jgi:hypothetical protein
VWKCRVSEAASQARRKNEKMVNLFEIDDIKGCYAVKNAATIHTQFNFLGFIKKCE